MCEIQWDFEGRTSSDFLKEVRRIAREYNLRTWDILVKKDKLNLSLVEIEIYLRERREKGLEIKGFQYNGKRADKAA